MAECQKLHGTWHLQGERVQNECSHNYIKNYAREERSKNSNKVELLQMAYRRLELPVHGHMYIIITRARFVDR